MTTPEIPDAVSDARKAVAIAAGWPWCDEHHRPRLDGPNPCGHLHWVDDDGEPKEASYGGPYE